MSDYEEDDEFQEDNPMLRNAHRGAAEEDDDGPPQDRFGGRGLEFEDGESFVRRAVGDVLRWRSPLQSALWLSTLTLTFFLIEFSEYSALTLFAYLVLLQLASTAVAIQAAPALKKVGLMRESFDPKIFALQRQAFSVDELQKFSQGAAGIVFGWIMMWNDALETTDARKVLKVAGLMFLLSVLGKLVSFPVFLYCVVLVAFSVPALYERQQEKIDEIWERVEDRTDEVWDRVYVTLGPVLDRLEPVLGRFD